MSEICRFRNPVPRICRWCGLRPTPEAGQVCQACRDLVEAARTLRANLLLEAMAEREREP